MTPVGAIANEGDLRAFVRREIGNLPELVRQLQGDVRGWSPDWQALALNSGWTDYGLSNSNYQAGYAESSSGLVRLRGFVERASSTWTPVDTIMTLPVAPSRFEPYLVPAYGGGVPGWAYVHVRDDGGVALVATSVTWTRAALNIIGLSGISFWRED